MTSSSAGQAATSSTVEAALRAGFDIMIGNGGMVTYGPGDRLTVQSLDIRMGGSNQLFAGPGKPL